MKFADEASEPTEPIQSPAPILLLSKTPLIYFLLEEHSCLTSKEELSHC